MHHARFIHYALYLCVDSDMTGKYAWRSSAMYGSSKKSDSKKMVQPQRYQATIPGVSPLDATDDRFALAIHQLEQLRKEQQDKVADASSTAPTTPSSDKLSPPPPAAAVAPPATVAASAPAKAASTSSDAKGEVKAEDSALTAPSTTWSGTLLQQSERKARKRIATFMK
jgi:hypothetical protein